MIKYEIQITTKKSIEVISNDDDEAMNIAHQIFDEQGLVLPTSEMEIVSSEPATEKDEMWYSN